MGADASLPGQQAATHYAVLALAPSMLDEAITTTTPSSSSSSSSSSSPSYSLVRKAYHRALLLHHPDKHHHSQPNRTTTSTTSTRTSSSSSSSSGGPLYTIDQIATAFAVLSSPQRRADYDALLQQQQQRQQQQHSTGTCSNGSSFFPTGVENVDLDDVAFDEDAERWYASCRCGNGRGYLFAERDLVLVEDEGVLMVACQDCSLWLRVHFAVLQRDGEDDDDDDDNDDDDDDDDDQDNMGHGDADQR